MSEQDPDYVTNGAWLRQFTRTDVIDDVADQFERPTARAAPGAEAFWSPAPVTRWPRRHEYPLHPARAG